MPVRPGVLGRFEARLGYVLRGGGLPSPLELALRLASRQLGRIVAGWKPKVRVNNVLEDEERRR